MRSSAFADQVIRLVIQAYAAPDKTFDELRQLIAANDEQWDPCGGSPSLAGRNCARCADELWAMSMLLSLSSRSPFVTPSDAMVSMK
jgi:hypothetical protein